MSEMLMFSGLEAQGEINGMLEELFGDEGAFSNEAGRGERYAPQRERCCQIVQGVKHLRVVQGGAQGSRPRVLPMPYDEGA